MSDSPLVIVVGPTGSGKSDLALHLAETFHGEIVNCDSVQLYRYLDIGTAKTPLNERRGIPHHLIDILDPDQVFTAADYVRIARPVLASIAHRGKIPVIAGGTGFYLRALLHGLSPGPERDEGLRERLLARKDRLHRILQRLDPEAAARIHPNDTKKTIRAVEVCLVSRRRMTHMFETAGEPLDGFHILKIGLNPDKTHLNVRLDFRCQEMFNSGIVEEVQAILHRGFPPESKALESIGYAQALRVVQGAIDLPDAIALTQAATRQYAKRQRTWFRREPGVHWFQAFGHSADVRRAGESLILNTFFV